jgi:hypothetical protein
MSSDYHFGASSIATGRMDSGDGEMAPNQSPVAPAIRPVAPDDRRRRRAAGCPTRRLSPVRIRRRPAPTEADLHPDCDLSACRQRQSAGERAYGNCGRGGRLLRRGDASEGTEQHDIESEHAVGNRTIACARCSRPNERIWTSAPSQIRRPPRPYHRTGVCEQLAGQVR